MPSCAEEQLGINEADKAMAVGAKPLAGSAMATLHPNHERQICDIL